MCPTGAVQRGGAQSRGPESVGPSPAGPAPELRYRLWRGSWWPRAAGSSRLKSQSDSWARDVPGHRQGVLSERPHREVKHIAVLPEFRGHGVGRMLMQALRDGMAEGSLVWDIDCPFTTPQTLANISSGTSLAQSLSV